MAETSATSVFVCYADSDRDFAHRLTRDLADLGFTVHDHGLTLWQAYRVKIEEAIKRSDYYIIVFSLAFFSERFASEQLNALFDSYVFKTGRGRKVLPIVKEMSWNELREKSPLFGTMRPMDAGKSDEDVKKLAKLFYGVVKKDRLPLPESKTLWDWDCKEQVERLSCDDRLSVRQVQLVDTVGNFSRVLVTDPELELLSESLPGDLIVEVDGQLLKSLTPDKLVSIGETLQSDRRDTLSYKVCKRKSTSMFQIYMDMLRKHALKQRDKQQSIPLPTTETVNNYWDRKRHFLDVVTPVDGLGLDALKTPDGDHYVYVTGSPTGDKLSRGDRIVSIDKNYIDLHQIDLETIERKLLVEANSVKLTVWRPRSPDKEAPSVQMPVGEKKLWVGQFEQCEVKKNGRFGLMLMKIKDPSSQCSLPVIKATAASGLFYGELIVAVNEIQTTDYYTAIQLLRNVTDGQQVLLTVQRPNKKLLDDYVSENYTENRDAPSDSEDSACESGDSEDDNGADDLRVESDADRTAIVGQEQRLLPLENAMQNLSTTDERQTTGLAHQVEDSGLKKKITIAVNPPGNEKLVASPPADMEVVTNPHADLRAAFFEDSNRASEAESEERPLTAWTDFNAPRTETEVASEPSGKADSTARDLASNLFDSVAPQGWFKQLISFVGETHSGCGEQKLAMDLLRSDWTGLVKKLDAKTVADKLYEHKIISFEDMEKVCTESSRADRNRHLLRLMSKRPWMDGVQFAKIISRVDGNQEIGRQLLLNAGLKVMGRPSTEDQSTVVSDLRSMITSVVESEMQKNFRPVLEMMTEIADSLTDK